MYPVHRTPMLSCRATTPCRDSISARTGRVASRVSFLREDLSPAASHSMQLIATTWLRLGHRHYVHPRDETGVRNDVLFAQSSCFVRGRIIGGRVDGLVKPVRRKNALDLSKWLIVHSRYDILNISLILEIIRKFSLTNLGHLFSTVYKKKIRK